MYLSGIIQMYVCVCTCKVYVCVYVGSYSGVCIWCTCKVGVCVYTSDIINMCQECAGC